MTMAITTLEALIGRAIGSSARPLPLTAIEAWQGARLRQTVEICRQHSPFYRRVFAAAGIGPVQGLDDLATLPLTTEADLRQHGADMVCVSQDAVARIVTLRSSGATGPPKRLWFTEEDLERTLDFFHLGMGNLVEPGQSVAILLPGATPDSTGHLLAQALTRMQVASHIVGLVSEPEAAAQTLADLRPEVVVGFPVQLLAVARTAAALNLSLETIRAALLCSDYVPESVRRCLHDLLGCEVFTHYGTTETGLGGGVDCPAHQGCHLREADLLFEIVDPATAAPLADGQWGEIVCTTLTRTGMPLIRYRTGDQGRLLPGPCPCGSHIRRLDRVLGRRNQVRRLQSGARLAMPDLDEWLFPVPGLLDFKACLVTAAGQDVLRLDLATLPGWSQEVGRLVAGILNNQAWLSGVTLCLTLNPGTTIHPAKRLLEDHREDQPL